MIVAEENVKPVMEELKDIRMNSRLQHTLQEDTVHHPLQINRKRLQTRDR
jgi:hypothetical protein